MVTGPHLGDDYTRREPRGHGGHLGFHVVKVLRVTAVRHFELGINVGSSLLKTTPYLR